MNNLKTLNVQELSVQEMKKTDGGWLLGGLGILAVVLILSSCGDVNVDVDVTIEDNGNGNGGNGSGNGNGNGNGNGGG